MQLRRAVRVSALIVAALAAWLVVSDAQEPQVPSSLPSLVADLTAPGTDRGLRSNDPPRAPHTAAAAKRIERSGRDLPYEPGSVIVKFRAGSSATARLASVASVAGVATETPSYANFQIVRIADDADPEAAARELSARPDVEYAQARYRVHLMFVPNDPLYSRQWNYPLIDMERAWDINPGASSSIVVAVIDSGVAFRSGIMQYNAPAFIPPNTMLRYPALGVVDVPFATAPDLGGSDRFVSPHDFIWDNNLPFDLEGHGTHVSGTIGQVTNNGVGVAGMAFNVRIMPVKVIDGAWDFIFNSPNEGTDDVVARGVRYAADNGANVLNMSIGRTGPPAPVVEEAIRYAVSRGAFVAIAAGNEFEVGNRLSRLAEIASRVDGAVSVAAVSRDRTRAYYSTTGSYLEIAAPGGDQRRNGAAGGILQQTYDLDFVDTFLAGPAAYRAPRFDIFVYEAFQGTSMAAPHVSGFAAMLLQQGITSPAAIEAIMKRYATDLGASGRDDEFGSGLINPRAALRGLGLVR
jgi:serine protease